MRRIPLIAGASGVCLVAFATFWLFSGRDSAHVPLPVKGAYLHLAFENSLQTFGAHKLSAQTRDGDAVFASGPTGQAYYAQGDGRYLELKTPELDNLADRVEISFDVKPENWVNPYKKSAPVKSIAVVSGKSGDRIRHVVFNLSNGEDPILTVAIEDAAGKKEKLKSQAGAMTMDWHEVRLLVDGSGRTSQLYLDGKLMAEAEVVPSVVSNGVDRVKLGTWHRQNQAFRGLLDNFVIRDANYEES